MFNKDIQEILIKILIINKDINKRYSDYVLLLSGNALFFEFITWSNLVEYISL